MGNRVQDSEHLASDESLEATNDLQFRLPFSRTALHITPCTFIVTESDDDDAMKGGIGPSIATSVEPVAVGLARRCGDRTHPAQGCESRLGLQALRIITGGDEQDGRRVGSHAERFKQRRGPDGIGVRRASSAPIALSSPVSCW